MVLILCKDIQGIFFKFLFLKDMDVLLLLGKQKKKQFNYSQDHTNIFPLFSCSLKLALDNAIKQKEMQEDLPPFNFCYKIETFFANTLLN